MHCLDHGLVVFVDVVLMDLIADLMGRLVLMKRPPCRAVCCRCMSLEPEADLCAVVLWRMFCGGGFT